MYRRGGSIARSTSKRIMVWSLAALSCAWLLSLGMATVRLELNFERNCR
jgi:hypothetical protein